MYSRVSDSSRSCMKTKLIVWFGNISTFGRGMINIMRLIKYACQRWMNPQLSVLKWR